MQRASVPAKLGVLKRVISLDRVIGLIAVGACVAGQLRVHPASAQDEPAVELRASDDSEDPAARADGEFAPGITNGPPLTLGPPPRPARSERGLAVQVSATVGAPFGSSLDANLGARGYGISPVWLGFDLTLVECLFDWFCVGGRLGARERGWDHPARTPALASGLDVLAVAQARAYTPTGLDLAVQLGLGGGAAVILTEVPSSLFGAPRLNTAVHLGVRLEDGFRLRVLANYDWFIASDLDRYGSDLDLGGLGVALGFEARL